MIYAPAQEAAGPSDSMLEVSDLIYETCKTYLLNQGKFILILWVCIAAVMVAYFGFLRGGRRRPTRRVPRSRRKA